MPNNNIHVVATEATREAINGVEFRDRIKQTTGWEVQLLPKNEEARIGALGIASSLSDITGIVLDLGGGSVQMSWMETKAGEVELKGSTSLPYGAAALTRRLQEAKNRPKMLDELQEEVRNRLKEAYQSIAGASKREQGTVPLYLSGGGFRGWGHVLMDLHPITPYPIPLINGFSVPASFFHDMASIETHLATSSALEQGIFRISSRRQSQLPAISFLIQQLIATIPSISTVTFAQGGVREGLLFDLLPSQIRAQYPLDVATAAYASPSTSKILELLQCTIPTSPSCRIPKVVNDVLQPYTNLLYHYSGHPKEAHAAAALHSTTHSLLASVHGVSHQERATLALLLCRRWGGEVAPTDESFLNRIQQLVGREVSWWCNYTGRVGSLLGAVFPSGVVRGGRVSFSAGTEAGKKGTEIILRVDFAHEAGDGDSGVEVFEAELKAIEKVGKPKNWIGGKEGWGYKLRVEAQTTPAVKP